MLWWGVGSSNSCSQMHTWCHLSRSVIPLAERGVGRSWTMKSGTNQESIAAASWRWGLTHRKQSVRGFRVWIAGPAGCGYLQAVLRWLGFQRERRAERRLPDHKTSLLKSISCPSFFSPRYFSQTETWRASVTVIVLMVKHKNKPEATLWWVCHLVSPICKLIIPRREVKNRILYSPHH